MDGFENRRNVYVVAATNRPDIIDPAMLRGGRLDKLLYVPLPDRNDRYQILQALTRKTPMKESEVLRSLAYSFLSEGLSGADLGTVVKEAALSAILKGSSQISSEELWDSLKKTPASLSPEDRVSYELLQRTLRQSKGHIRRDSRE
jgi:ribosome biogenesis ATPase